MLLFPMVVRDAMLHATNEFLPGSPGAKNQLIIMRSRSKEIRPSIQTREKKRSLLKSIVFIYRSTECISPFYNASFDIFGAKIGRFFTAQSALNISWNIEHWPILLQNWLKSQFSRNFKHWLWTVQSINFDFAVAKRSVMNGAMTFF